jgi:hypothetical protein
MLERCPRAKVNRRRVPPPAEHQQQESAVDADEAEPLVAAADAHG